MFKVFWAEGLGWRVLGFKATLNYLRDSGTWGLYVAIRGLGVKGVRGSGFRGFRVARVWGLDGLGCQREPNPLP